MAQWDESVCLFLLTINAYAINAFNIAIQEQGWQFSYESLFYAVWDTIVKIAIAIVFTGICWLILLLWSQLFTLIGMRFFKVLFEKHWFIIWSLSFFSSIGLYLASQIKTVVRNLRMILLLICQYLLLVLALIELAFLASYLFILLFFRNEITLDSTVFLSIAFITLIFTNGVFQGGSVTMPYSRHFLNRLLNLALFSLPVFVLLGLYDIFTLAKESGLTGEVFHLLINGSLLFVYSLAYAYAALRSKPSWMHSLQKSNVVLAVILIMTTLALNNPLFEKASFNPGKKGPVYSEPTIEQTMAIEEKENYLFSMESFEKSGLFWHASPKPLLSMGYNDHDILLCRGKINNVQYAGVVNNGKCQIIVKEAIQDVTNYQILSSMSGSISWYPYLPYKGYEDYNSKKTYVPLVVGDLDNPDHYICRVIYDNQITVGVAARKGERPCKMIVYNKIVTTNDNVQYLFFEKKQ